MEELIKALIAAKQEMGAVTKSVNNPFFKAKYAPLHTVIEVTDPALHKHGLTITQTTDIRNGQPILITTLHHVSGEYVEGYYPIVAKEENNPQVFGASLTYARRYALMAILGLAPEDDDGNSASGVASKEMRGAATPRMITTKQQNEIKKLAGAGDVDTFLRVYTSTPKELMTEKEAASIIALAKKQQPGF